MNFGKSLLLVLGILLLSLMGCGNGDGTVPANVIFRTGSPPAHTRTVTLDGNQYVAGEILIQIRDSGSAESIRDAARKLVEKLSLGTTIYTGLSEDASRQFRWYHFTVSEDRDLAQLLAAVKANPAVEDAELNGILFPTRAK